MLKWTSIARAHSALATAGTNTPVLHGARIKDKWLEATDLDMTIRVKLPVPCDGTGCIADAKALIRLAPDAVTITAEQVVAKSGRRTARMATLPEEDFPIFPDVDPRLVWRNGDAVEVVNALLACGPFASDEETRYYLNGVYLDAHNGSAVATNGHELRLVPIPARDRDKERGIIVPNKAVKALAALGVAPTRIEVGSVFGSQDSHIRIIAEEAEIVAKGIPAEYVDYSRVIPAMGGAKTVVRADWGALDGLAKDAAKIMGKQVTTLKVAATSDGVECSIKAPDGSAEVSDRLDGTEIVGEPVTFGVNINYLRRAVGAFSAPVELFVKSPSDPLLLVSDDPHEGRAVVMPLRVR